MTKTEARKALDCIETLFNGFDSKQAPWGAMQEIYEGRRQLEEIVRIHFKSTPLPDWIPGKRERIQYKDMDTGKWKEGIVDHVSIKEGKFIAFVEFDNTGRWAQFTLDYVRKLMVNAYE
jgi:hypothetical protein